MTHGVPVIQQGAQGMMLMQQLGRMRLVELKVGGRMRRSVDAVGPGVGDGRHF